MLNLTWPTCQITVINLEKKISFLYTIHGPCRGQTFVTEDCDFAQEASEHGLIVNCVMIGGKDE